MSRAQFPYQPKNIVLWVLAEIEKAFDAAPPSAGREKLMQGAREFRALLAQEWTPEREAEVFEREKQRWDATVVQGVALVGAEAWDELESEFKAVVDAVVRILRRAHEDWVEMQRSDAWQTLSTRIRDAALNAASRTGLIEAGDATKQQLASLVELDPLQLLKGQGKSMGALLEEATMFASSKLSAGKAWSSKEDEDSLRAFVKFRDAARPPASFAEVLVKVSQALPVMRAKVGEAEKQVDAGAALKTHEYVVAQCLTAMSEDKLSEWADSAAAFASGGEAEARGAIAAAVSQHEYGRAAGLAKSAALAWIMKLLPHAKLPPMEGVREGFAYTVRNLDLSNFSVLPDNCRVSFQGTFGSVRRGDPFCRVVVDDVSTVMRNLSWEFKQENFPYLTGQGQCDADVRGVCVVLGLQVVRRPVRKLAKSPREGSGAAEEGGKSSPAQRAADGGAAEDDEDERLDDEGECVPQLVLGVSRVHIDSVKLELKGMAFGTMLADMFSATIRTYLASLLEDEILEKANVALERVNREIHKNWDAIAAAVDVRVSELPTEARAARRAVVLDAPVSSRKDVYSVTFALDGPLGIVLAKSHEFVVVRGFKRDADGAMFPGEASGKVKVGDVLCGLNGAEITSLPLDRVTARLARARRPLTLTFSAGQAEGVAKRNNVAVLQFSEPKLGLLIKERAFEDRAAVVTGFKPLAAEGSSAGGEGPAQKAGVPVGWVLAAINGQDMLAKNFKQTMEAFAAAARPVELKFVREPWVDVDLLEPATDLKVAFMGGALVVARFDHLVGPAQTQCGDKLESGDYVSMIGGKDTSLMRFEEVVGLVRAAPRPLEIRFGRAGVGPNVCSALFGPGPLGLVFYKSGKDAKCCFKTFQGIEGPVERLKTVLPGFVLVKVGGADVTSEEQARALLAKFAGGKLRFKDMDAWKDGKW